MKCYAGVHVRELRLVETAVGLGLEAAAAHLGPQGAVPRVVGGGSAGAVEWGDGGCLRDVADVGREEPRCKGWGLAGNLFFFFLRI